jgi:hypothetical protein
MQFEFAAFMVGASKVLPISELIPADVVDMEKAMDKPEDLVKEINSLLKWNADRRMHALSAFSGGLVRERHGYAQESPRL